MKKPFTQNEIAPHPLAVFSAGMAFVVLAAVTQPEPTQQVAKAPEAASPAWNWQGPAPLGGPVDWNAIEVSPNAGPLAIAAYEPDQILADDPPTPRPVRDARHASASSFQP